MSGDISLSQSLGGLRVTNPDEGATSPTSPTRPPLPSSRSSESTVTGERQTILPALPHEHARHEGDSFGLGFDPEQYRLYSAGSSTPPQQPPQAQQHQQSQLPSRSPSTHHHNPRLSHRSSIPLGHHAQQQAAQYPAHSSNYSPQRRTPSAHDASQRPISAMYTQTNHSASSGTSSQGSYRYDLGSPEGGEAALARSGSRSARPPAAAAAAAVLPQREASRTYRQASVPINGSNGSGPWPPRRNSRRGRAPTGGSNSTGGYDGGEQTYGAPNPVPRAAEDWRDRRDPAGTQKETDAPGQQSQTRSSKKGVKDFNFGRTLGEGSYSTVLAATDRQNLKEYAIKVLDKRHIIKEKKVKYVNIERDTLNRLTEHPGIVRLYYTFQDERSLYFVLDLASGGELLGVLKKLGSFDVGCTQFYGAEILDSIAYMHSRGVIHRDLKPENVLLDRDMHVKITDFGTAKILPDPRPMGGNGSREPFGDPTDGAESDRAVSFVGTAEYVSPELLRDKNACKASDLWAFGCIIYQLLAGRPPFKAANEYLTFQKILSLDYTFPDGFPELARDLVERLLVLEPANRLPIEHIKNHRFFEGVQWGKALWRQKSPRLQPHLPPPPQPIKLNGTSKSNRGGNALANMGAAVAMQNAAAAAASSSQPPASTPALAPVATQAAAPTAPRRPQLQNVTDLPPPSQLDIDWSPVLTHNNERILKLGNLIVTSAPQATSPTAKNGEPATPSEKPKFSRFFSGTTTKKRERLVLITSRARLLVAAAGGSEKKVKVDINLAAHGPSCQSCVDAKGLTYWSLETRDKHYTFEDPRATTSDPAGSKYTTSEWLEAVEQAREVALATSLSNSYSGESMLTPSAMSSPSDSLGGDAAMPLPGAGPSSAEARHNLRYTLRNKNNSTTADEENSSLKGKRRFSKRNSKSGLYAAVF